MDTTKRRKEAPGQRQPNQGRGTSRPPHGTPSPGAIQDQSTGPAQPSAVQRKRILAWLRRYGSMTTLQARNELHVMHPGGRVMELRRAGLEIVTVRLPSRIARYILTEEARP